MEGLKEEPTGGLRTEPGAPAGAAASASASSGTPAPAGSPAPAVRPRTRRRPAFHALRVASLQPLCEDAVAVGFEIPAELAEEFAFAPGQSLTLRREIDGRDERRSYSICSPAGSAPRIGVRVVPGGLFSSWLVNDVRSGDTVEVMGPTGFFTPDLAAPGHHVLIAAGSGITPMVSIAESVLAADPRSTVTLFYGNRRSGTVMFADELADLKDLYPARFQLAHVLSREPREAEVLSGRLDADRLSSLIGALVDVDTADHWWLCGPHGMVRDAQRVLAGLDVPDDRVHQELFYADDEPVREARHEEAAAEGPVSEVTVTLDGRSTTAALSRERSILEGAQRTRPDLPFACKGGVCGTCRALVTDGKADMRRNFALEPAEVDAGYVLTCQSFPVSETLTVDYDT
ncbi:phenylacetate-CoA oxygenase/reductase subunit PaaK [Streptomyces europaeiscabiei]|uniref:Phenylacetate-CoA oxygenase/reductase subunit PaaK n=1 Tax=Streptomyces europaeiscabiei TaxID=146819 RepID=A0ABU4NQY3_9ACTN|nr:1,2-phenylacetyl-CoA epoxidase subunit PaaE [Streptomyces europaeiscabiei]MDX2764880.1 phenylacetate-CoA oxygenase/reductase subunit PaaK [Streptomyces europaeiscabiei]MDX2775573.1 phenylacetate-CoA oxygenase/reductase subunit PaaK [Streptomyces europaeiscabiei]MDX3546608.1 phenylacetate-CoA oxygenase/reductase subunit PaaK [Streptomyces europaeiscabiei]MDX3556302.1 phenylacetate-CoA oxygenase/reductase subunit PaaK [Streptomyces europaeiscabiei]MDX3704209.1 phenylacetate-CoA oxygenase/redu